MTGRAIGAGAVLLLLGACSGGDYGGNDANGQEPRIRIANEHHEQLLKLPPNGQRLTMMRAIRSTGNRCQRVDNAGYQEEYRNMRMWVAVCGQEQKTFAIYLAANGDVQVRDCAEAGQLALPRCQGLPPPMQDDSGPEFKEGAADKAFRNQF